MFKQPRSAPHRRGIHRTAILMTAAAAALGATAAYGQNIPPPPVRQNDWIGATTPTGADWLVASNWAYDHDGDSNTPPTNTLPTTLGNHFATINNNGLAIVNAPAEAAFLTLGMTYRGPGDFDTGHLRVEPGAVLTLGELRVGGRESLKSLQNLTEEPNPDPYLQDGGTGTVLQTGGTVNVNYTHGQNPGGGAFWEPPVQSMYVGDSGMDGVTPGAMNHAQGTYHITGGTLNVGLFRDDALVVGTGLGTQGTFIQESGNVTSMGNVIVGRRGATATYTISDGSLTVHGTPGLAIGDGDAGFNLASTHGTFTQNGGTVNVRSDVRVGRRNGTGVYNMSSGTLNIATADSIYFVPGANPGDPPIDAGVSAGTLNIGSLGEDTNADRMNSIGTFNLSGDAVINIGRASDGTAFVSNLNVGLGNTNTAGSPTGNRGFLNMTSGTINMHRPGAQFIVGNGAGVVGTADISGGTVNNTADTASAIDIGRNNGSGLLKISGTAVINTSRINFATLSAATTPAATRSVEINGGTVDVGVVTFGVNNSRAMRSFKVTNGTVNVGELILGAITSPGTSIADISGGDVEIGKMTLAGGSEFKLSNMNFTIPGRVIVSAGAGNTGKFNVAAGQTLTLAGGVTSFLEVVIPAAARGFRTSGPGTLTIEGPQAYEPLGTTLHHDTGTLNLNSTADANLTLNANSTTNLNSSQRLRALNVGANATTTMPGTGDDKTLHVNTLTVSTTAGKLDMTDNDMIVNYPAAGPSPEFTLRDKVLNARAGGTHGIFFTGSDDEFSDKVLAFGEAAELGFTEFNGATVDDTTVLGKYTYYGDANFDGQVTTDDYVAVDLGLGTGDSWVQGDFDLNGSVTTDDYVVVDLNLGKGTDNPLAYAEDQAAMIALHTEMFGQSYLDKLAYASEFGWVAASVPEPGALSLVGVAALGLFARRRRATR